MKKNYKKDLEKMSSQKRNFLIRVLISGKKQQKNSFYTWILRLMFNKQTKKKAIF